MHFQELNVLIPIPISRKFITTHPINNISALVQIMAWRRLGDEPLSEPLVVRLPTYICVTRPQWVKNGVYFLQDSRCVHLQQLDPILTHCQHGPILAWYKMGWHWTGQILCIWKSTLKPCRSEFMLLRNKYIYSCLSHHFAKQRWCRQLKSFLMKTRSRPFYRVNTMAADGLPM